MATFRKLESGRWQAVIRKRGYKPVSATFRTKAQAEDWARSKEDEMVRKVYRDNATAERMLVSGLLAKYEEDITPRKRSAKKEESRIRILTASLGDISIAALAASPALIIDYVDERLESVISDTVRKELNTLGHAIATGMALWGINLPANPVTTAKEILSVTKTLEPGVERNRRVADWELEKIVAFSGSEKLCPIVWIAVGTAMRRGELAKAKAQHIDVNSSTIHIPETKTDKPRTIPLTKAVLSVLESITPDPDTGRLFDLKADSISQEFNRSKEKAGILDVRFHDLRHEATSRFFEMDLSIQEVAAITGHTDWKSLKRYTHIQPAHLVKKFAEADQDKPQRQKHTQDADSQPETS